MMPRTHDPDAFDAWLDALFAAPPGAEPHPGQPDAPEAAAAREMRTLAARTDALALPIASWKEILMDSQHAAPTAIAATSLLTPTSRPDRRPPARIGPALNRLVSIAAILAIVLAGFATAWVSRDRFGFGGDDRSALEIAASPSATITCTTRTLSQEEVDRIVAAYQEPTLADYTLTDKTVPMEDALAAIATFRAESTCPDGEPGTDSLRWAHSIETEQVVAMRNLATSPAWTANLLSDYKVMLEPLSRELMPPPTKSYVVDSRDPAIQPYLFYSYSTGNYAMLPDRFVQFADGRIGAPLLRALPLDSSSAIDYSPYTFTFYIFRKVDGLWLLDDAPNYLCPENCADAQDQIDLQIAKYQRLATVIG
ncbi:MAG: hypothetical protein WBA46_02835, partial [Thermomicrobiales bacterium]